jgi:hypothetical protein
MSLGEYKAKVKGRKTRSVYIRLQMARVAQNGQAKKPKEFELTRNLTAAKSVMYSNPRYDGGRFTLSPQKRPPLLLLTRLSPIQPLYSEIPSKSGVLR